MRKKRWFVFVACLLVCSLACKLATAQERANVQSSIEATMTAMAALLPTSPPTPQVNTQATAAAQATADALATVDAQSTANAAATASLQAAATQNAAATATQIAGHKLTATSAVQLTATAQASDFTKEIQKLFDQGLVGSLEGEYVRLPDFDESWAKIDYFHWYGTGYDLENFVARADVWYSSASDKANWFNAGCGFLFGEKDSDNFHRTYVSLDGYANFKKHVGGQNLWVEKKRYGNLPVPVGQFKLLLAVYNKHVAFYVDGAEMFNTFAPQLQRGEFNYVLSSGTNAGYGMRCKISNVDLWIFK